MFDERRHGWNNNNNNNNLLVKVQQLEFVWHVCSRRSIRKRHNHKLQYGIAMSMLDTNIGTLQKRLFSIFQLFSKGIFCWEMSLGMQTPKSISKQNDVYAKFATIRVIYGKLENRE